jgi:hypothetical protein
MDQLSSARGVSAPMCNRCVRRAGSNCEPSGSRTQARGARAVSTERFMKKRCCDSRNKRHRRAGRSSVPARYGHFVVRSIAASVRKLVGRRPLTPSGGGSASFAALLHRCLAAIPRRLRDLVVRLRTRFGKQHPLPSPPGFGIDAHGVTHPQDHGIDRECSIVFGIAMSLPYRREAPLFRAREVFFQPGLLLSCCDRNLWHGA